jgi:hypothetical protein
MKSEGRGKKGRVYCRASLGSDQKDFCEIMPLDLLGIRRIGVMHKGHL